MVGGIVFGTLLLMSQTVPAFPAEVDARKTNVESAAVARRSRKTFLHRHRRRVPPARMGPRGKDGRILLGRGVLLGRWNGRLILEKSVSRRREVG